MSEHIFEVISIGYRAHIFVLLMMIATYSVALVTIVLRIIFPSPVDH